MVRKWLFVVYIIVLILGVCTVVCNTANATIYYLSAGTTGGNEDGSSLANAWKTIADIEGLASGDTLYCAGTFNEQLTVADTVSYVVIPDSTWVIDGGDTRTYGIYGNGKSGVIIDGATIKNMRKDDHGYGVYFIGGSNNTVKNCDISEVYYATNPNPGTTAWEVQRGYGIYFAKSDNPTITNNTVKDVGGTAIMITTWGGVNLTGGTINNNEVTNMNVGIRVALGNDGNNISNVKIHNNYLHDHNNYYTCGVWHRDFIHIFARPSPSTSYVDSIEIYNNNFEDLVNHTSGGTASIYIEYNCKDFAVHHNVFNNNPGAYAVYCYTHFSGGIYGGHKIYNNTIYGENGGVTLNGSTDNSIKNNIIQVKRYMYSIYDASSKTDLTIDYNITNKLTGGSFDYCYIYPTYYRTFAGYQALGYDTNGYSADPLFVGGAGETSFQLQADSPAIDVGADLGFTADAIGDTIPQGVAPDIGAFEFSTTPTPPSDLTQTVNLPRHSVFTFVDNASDEDGFQVMINGVVTDSLAANTETFSIDNQTPGATYNVQIRAYKGDYLSGATVVNFTAPRYRLGRVR